MRMCARVLIAVFLVCAMPWWFDAQMLEAQVGTGQQKAVLVTGASTGIGRTITEVLAANGYFVYAGARKEQDLRDLNAIENVQSIRLDVTIQDEIDAAVETIRLAVTAAFSRGMSNLGSR